MATECTVHIDGCPCSVPVGVTVVAALVHADRLRTRRSVGGEARFALCGMGQCQECRVTIDGIEHQLGCQVQVHEGMRIATGETL